jgi:hypothetical protein
LILRHRLCRQAALAGVGVGVGNGNGNEIFATLLAGNA